ncbi:MAG: leader peptide processing enzyme [Treponemataceae bacterium]
MNKKANTVFFLIGATVFNVLITIVSFLVLIVLYGRLLAPLLPESAAAWGLPVIFVAAIAIAFFVYRVAVKLLLKRFKAEDIFGSLSNRRKGND